MGEGARQGVRRRGRIRAVTAAALAGLVLAVVPSGATAAPVLDANCPGPASGDLPPTLIGQRQAQTFTAGHTGGLTSASLAINKQTPGAFQLQVLATDSNGVPTNTVLGSAAFPNNAVPFGQATLAASFSPAIFVTAGQRYASRSPRRRPSRMGCRFAPATRARATSSSARLRPGPGRWTRRPSMRSSRPSSIRRSAPAASRS
jgi:hypothetical protein